MPERDNAQRNTLESEKGMQLFKNYLCWNVAIFSQAGQGVKLIKFH